MDVLGEEHSRKKEQVPQRVNMSGIFEKSEEASVTRAK